MAQHLIFKDRAFKMILTDLLLQIFLSEDPSAGFAPFQAAVDSCYSPFAHIPLAKGRTGFLNFSESAMREVIQSQQLNSGERKKKRWSDRHRSHTGLNSSRTLSQYINAAVPHHNFYPALVIAYLLSKRELPFVEITAFFLLKIGDGCFAFHLWKEWSLSASVANVPSKWYVLGNSCNLFIIFLQQNNSKTSFK